LPATSSRVFFSGQGQVGLLGVAADEVIEWKPRECIASLGGCCAADRPTGSYSKKMRLQ
jgi:hypothetical protein